jgi:hypothetical protein
LVVEDLQGHLHNSEPSPVSRSMLAAIVKRHGAPDLELKKRVRLELIEEARKEAARSFEYGRKEHDALKQKVAMFEQATGLTIARDYHGPRLGEAVAAVLKGDVDRRLQMQRDGLAHLLADMDAQLAAMIEDHAR